MKVQYSYLTLTVFIIVILTPSARADHNQDNAASDMKPIQRFGRSIDLLNQLSYFLPLSRACTASTRRLTRNMLNQVGYHGSYLVDAELALEDILFENEARDEQETPHYRHFLSYPVSLSNKYHATNALRVIQASKRLKIRMGYSAKEALYILPKISTLGTVLETTCPHRLICRQSKYRTIDGSCNNFKAPTWGRSGTVMQRILPPEYSDGVYSPRKAVDGSELPSARLVSSEVIPDIDNPNQNLNLMLMTFGQLLVHEISLAPISVFGNGSSPTCCTSEGQFLETRKLHPQCFPIKIPEADPFYGPFKRRCMNFVRSMPGERSDCTFGFAQQLNAVTSYVDGSAIYGSTKQRMNALRSFRGGKLRYDSCLRKHSTLPVDPNPSTGVCIEPCYQAGDVRSQEQPQLTALHNVWVREHNRVANQLSSLNPTWGDETLFQETRRIVITKLVLIVYREFLPVVLGSEVMQTYDLVTDTDEPDLYDETVNPSLINEFGVAAFRMGHSLIQGIIKLFDNDETSTSHYLSWWLQKGPPEEVGWQDKALRGLLNQPMQNFDSSMTSQVTTKLFIGQFSANSTYGFDLAALNTQRGRDHGLPGYNSYREAVGLSRAICFEDLAPVIPVSRIGALQRVYRSVDDVDLWVAGLNEVPLPGALVGPTFASIIANQFRRLKTGDRFFPTRKGLPHSFREDQLVEIRKVTMARIICDNNEGNIHSVQPLAFRIPSFENPKMSCDSIPQMDLTPWAAEPPSV